MCAGLALRALWRSLGCRCLFGGFLIVLTMAGGPFKAAHWRSCTTCWARSDIRPAHRSERSARSWRKWWVSRSAVRLSRSSARTSLSPSMRLLSLQPQGLCELAYVHARPLLAKLKRAIGEAFEARFGLSGGNRRTRGLLAMAWLVGLFVVPEGLAAPYAAQLGGTVAAVGFLMAADPLGSIVGAWLCGRMTEENRSRLLVPLAVLAGVALIFCATGPSIPVSVMLWAVSGWRPLPT